MTARAFRQIAAGLRDALRLTRRSYAPAPHVAGQSVAPDIPVAAEPDRFAEYRAWKWIEQQGRGGRGAPRDERGRFTKGGCGG